MFFKRTFGGSTKLDRTARLYLAYKFFGSLFFAYPIFYQFASQTISPVHVGVFFSAISVCNFVCDIPSGVIADKWSRKYSSLIGVTLACMAPITVLSAHNFAGYLLAALWYGTSRAFLNGTLESLVYDHKNVDQAAFRRINVLEITCGQAGILVSAFCGGFLFSQNHSLPFVAETIAGVICFGLIMCMQERYKSSYVRAVGSHRQHFLQSIGYLFATPYLRTIVLMGAAFSVMLGMCIQFVNEAAMIEHGFHATTRGLLVSGAGVATLFILNLFLLRRVRSDSQRIMYLSAGAVAAYALMAAHWASLFLVGYLVWSCLNATSSFIRVMIQDHIPASHRATVLSSFKSVAVLTGILGSTLTGWLVQSAHTPRAAYLLFSAISVAVIVPCAVWLLTHLARRQARTLLLATLSADTTSLVQ
jgi:MFS family permease